MLTDQRLEGFVDRSQQFWSAALLGHIDVPSANGDVYCVLPIIIV